MLTLRIPKLSLLLSCFFSVLLPAITNGQKPKVDTVQINSQLTTVKSLIDVREFTAAKKIAQKVYAEASAANYLEVLAWSEFYLGVISFELTPVDSAFYWLHWANTHFNQANDSQALVQVLNHLGLFYRHTDFND
ncbi:MAG TPA: hypothetical protein DDY04_06915, partial [Bacteroidales bacterium]|nr:hypothetical protein [Bacteroidales bacterium]